MPATDVIRGRQTATRTLTNKSGGGVVLGDVVYIGDAATDNSFTTGTTAAFNDRMVGVAMETIASNAAGLVALSGYVPKVNSAAGLTREHFLFTSTVAKEATGSATRGAGAFGQVLESQTDPEAIIWGMPDSDAVSTVAPGTEFDYGERTAGTLNITNTVEASADTICTGAGYTFDGATSVMVEIYLPYAHPDATANRYLVVLLFDGSTSLGFMALVETPVTTQNLYVPVLARRKLTPSAAAHTYSARAIVSAGTGVVVGGAGGTGAYMPAYVRVTKA